MARSHEWSKTRKRAFNRDRKANAKCGICKRAIDYSLGMNRRDHYNPLAYEPDHILPLVDANGRKHPERENDLANIQAAHAGCNRKKSNKAGISQLGIPSEDW